MKGFHLLHQTSSFPRFILARRDVGVAGSNPVTPTSKTNDYHLTAMLGIDAVASTRWVWNGRERRQTDVVQARAVAPDEAVET
jgi:hypothetical protein